MVRERELIWNRVARRMRLGITAANLIGVATVSVFLTVLVPLPRAFAHDTALLALNGALLALAGVLGTITANTAGIRSVQEVRSWFLSGEPADGHQRALALRTPLNQLKICAAIWVVGGVVFTVINVFSSVAVATQSAITIPLGGLASCAVTYLLAERYTREITSTALADGPPERPVGPGVGTRMIVAWGLAAGFPLLGSILLAVSVLVVGHWSTTRIAVSLLTVSATGLALGFWATLIAGRSVADPIEAVRAAQRKVQGGDLTVRIPVYDGSEVGLLQAGFNDMTAGLLERERIREAFGTYLDREVAEHVLRSGTSLAGEEVEVTAMFIDIRDFTGLAERASAREVVATINRLFERVVPTIHRHGGHVDKFVGDGLLAVFGAPRRQADHPDRALAAALDVERTVHEEFAGELAIGIGLSSGAVIAGNVGGAGRLEFSVIGDAVNVAARVEHATRETGDTVLISENTRALLSPASASRLERRPARLLKGKSDPVALFAPRAMAKTGSGHQPPA